MVEGAGSAARGILGSLLERYPAFVTVIDRTVVKAKDPVDLFSAQGKIRAGGFDELNVEKVRPWPFSTRFGAMLVRASLHFSNT